MSTDRQLPYAFVAAYPGGISGSALPIGAKNIDPAAALGKAAAALYVVQLIPTGAGGLQEVGTASDDADNQAAGTDRPVYLARLQAFDGVNYDRLRLVSDLTDGQAALNVGVLAVGARLQGSTGAGWDQLMVSSAAAHTEAVEGSTQRGLIVNKLANFSVHADPAAAAVASVSRAAGGLGVKHICTSIHATLNAGAGATGIIKLYLRDGAAGVGAILWSASIQAPAAGFAKIELSDLSILGSANAPMTLEFSAAGGAGSQENVSFTGYSVF